MFLRARDFGDISMCFYIELCEILFCLNKCCTNAHLGAGKNNDICLFLQARREEDNSYEVLPVRALPLKLRVRILLSCCLPCCSEEGANFKGLRRPRGTRMSFREKQVQEGYQIIHIYVNPQSYQSYQKYLYTKPSDFV